MYKVQYLPIALKDLREITTDITDILKAPNAAMELLGAFEDSIRRIQEFPYSCKLYQMTDPLETEYRILPVQNYLVFYVVKESVVEIHRVIYARMNIEKVIK